MEMDIVYIGGLEGGVHIGIRGVLGYGNGPRMFVSYNEAVESFGDLISRGVS